MGCELGYGSGAPFGFNLDQAGAKVSASAPDRLAAISASTRVHGRIERSFAFLAVSTRFVGIIGSGFTDPNPMRMPFAPFGVPSALTPQTLGRHRTTNRTRLLQEIGSASRKERVCRYVKFPVVAVPLKKKKN